MDRKKVLIIDDSEDSLFLLESCIEKEFPRTYEVYTKREPAEALLGFEKEYTHVFIDIAMPVVNGLETIKLLKNALQKDNECSPKFIAYTCFLERDHECQQAGFDTLLAKPFTLNDLREVMQEE